MYNKTYGYDKPPEGTPRRTDDGPYESLRTRFQKIDEQDRRFGEPVIAKDVQFRRKERY